MTPTPRKSERIVDFLPVEVHAVDEQNNRTIAGPFSGWIIDISAHGACLLMTQIMHNNFHAFHSTRDIENAVLRINIAQPPDILPCALIARPVWLDIFRQQKLRAFKMGVMFTEDPEKKHLREILASLRNNQEKRGNWWQKHFQKPGN